jgi:hypothetical protein
MWVTRPQVAPLFAPSAYSISRVSASSTVVDRSVRLLILLNPGKFDGLAVYVYSAWPVYSGAGEKPRLDSCAARGKASKDSFSRALSTTS